MHSLTFRFVSSLGCHERSESYSFQNAPAVPRYVHQLGWVFHSEHVCLCRGVRRRLQLFVDLRRVLPLLRLLHPRVPHVCVQIRYRGLRCLVKLHTRLCFVNKESAQFPSNDHRAAAPCGLHLSVTVPEAAHELPH